MLAAVLSLFMIFSFTGVAALNLSSFTAMETQDAVQTMKNQYSVESALNVALWRINASGGQVSNFTDGPVSAEWDSLTNELSVSIDRYDKQLTIDVYLGEDHHFNHALSATDSIDFGGNDVDMDTEPRDFTFLPIVDMDYWNSRAVQVHNHTWWSLSNQTLTPGVHIFNGNWMWIEDVTLEGTAIFTGRFIFFLGENNITAPADSLTSDPALVFTNDRNVVYLNNDNIYGAIYSAGRIILQGGNISGPVTGKVINIQHSYSFWDTENRHFYKWTRGFGDYSSYNWPKNIGRWRTSYTNLND
jgi:hypothetical protein